jgi:hypothetical protein
MSEMNFTEDDKQKLVEFLNMVAKHAKFELSTAELIQYFKLLSHMQTKMIPKIDANILEIKRIIEAKEQVNKQE